MQEYFIALVDGTIEASVKYVREYVHAYLNDVLEDARSQIQTYGQSFNATMQAALHTRQQGVLSSFLSCVHPMDFHASSFMVHFISCCGSSAAPAAILGQVV